MTTVPYWKYESWHAKEYLPHLWTPRVLAFLCLCTATDLAESFLPTHSVCNLGSLGESWGNEPYLHLLDDCTWVKFSSAKLLKGLSLLHDVAYMLNMRKDKKEFIREKQIRWVFDDNLGMILHMSLWKNTLWVFIRRLGDFNEYW